ncbi:hypothetical protein BKA67DRAFT_658240 [Truncatella angustata]|uniref:Uncharacterized protein n=1 Tax=Truncatella angustata TaxID=152316 RepID=A0A9P8ZYD1_9PEZI|nr:uncharacterized protein BKA67DRAFT_658240 [Truncatella angustata]KAH6653901.1 hypothetical protein BKA67DRAFT_658240 [Truncatella angustata]KAH8198107.1 hypothetical protein TruAng_007728 [Truncatella angustata]
MLTPEQLKTHLISYYISNWRANGVPVTLRDVLAQKIQGKLDSDGPHTKEIRGVSEQAEEVYLSMKHTHSYLKVRLDDSPPKDAIIKAHYADIKNFMEKNADVVSSMSPILDRHIEQHNLVDWYDTMPMAQMSMKEKVNITKEVQLIARHELELSDEPRPASSPILPTLKVCLINIGVNHKLGLQFHETTVSRMKDEHEKFLIWLESLAPQCQAISNWDVYNSIGDDWEPKALALYEPEQQTLQSSDDGRLAVNRSWSYKKLELIGRNPQLVEDWKILKTCEDFNGLLDEFLLKPKVYPVFVRSYMIPDSERHTVQGGHNPTTTTTDTDGLGEDITG